MPKLEKIIRALSVFAITIFASIAVSGNALAQRTAPVSVSTGGAPTGGYGSSQFGNGSPSTLQYTSQNGCRNCGVVESVREIKSGGEGSAAASLGGAALGGVVGRNFGDGRGRDAATIAGALIGGAVANKAAKSRNTTTTYETVVRMDDGSTQTLNQSGVPKWRTGQEVQLNNGALSPR